MIEFMVAFSQCICQRGSYFEGLTIVIQRKPALRPDLAKALTGQIRSSFS